MGTTDCMDRILGEGPRPVRRQRPANGPTSVPALSELPPCPPLAPCATDGCYVPPVLYGERHGRRLNPLGLRVPFVTEALLLLPPYAPQLSPVERLFEEIQQRAANRPFDSLTVQEEYICEAIREWRDLPKHIRQLCKYGWI